MEDSISGITTSFPFGSRHAGSRQETSEKSASVTRPHRAVGVPTAMACGRVLAVPPTTRTPSASDPALSAAGRRLNAVEQRVQHAVRRAVGDIAVSFRNCLWQSFSARKRRQGRDRRVVPEHRRRQFESDKLLDVSSNRHRHHRVEAQLRERPVQFEFGLRHSKFAGQDGSAARPRVRVQIVLGRTSVTMHASVLRSRSARIPSRPQRPHRRHHRLSDVVTVHVLPGARRLRPG